MNRQVLRRLPTIALFAILTAALFTVLAPNIEETRLESRVGEAYRNACEIAQSTIAQDESFAEDSSTKTDPWGQPYRFQKTTSGVRIISNGPNHITSANGLDFDDIHSDMPNSPIDTIHRKKRRQLLFVLLLPFVWLVGSIAYLAVGIQ